MKKVARSRYMWGVLALIVGLVLVVGFRGGTHRKKLDLSTFKADLAVPGRVVTATIHDGTDQITGKLGDGTAYQLTYPDRLADTLTEQMLAARVRVNTVHGGSSFWEEILVNYGGSLIVLGAIVFLLYSMQNGGGSRVMQFGKARARTTGKDQPKVTFADVAGADEAVAELQEIKEFLENPARFQALGAKIPRGVLLFGPPGTGKTLLARAVAGEAGVPFFSISGSDFVEMFVGVGASRVRDLFEQAKANAPSIVFMDEIDAVGRHRGAGLGGGHDEREQTLNQLLVEMDGFDIRGGVILIAATNRPDILDPALLRPGRFDRQIVVDRPDLAGRRQILAVHARGKPLAAAADLDVLAKRTPGFTGADLANLLNEAAILTARRNLRQIGMRECEEAIDRVLAGPERKTLVMSEHDKLVTAYHEAGHAIVGHVLPHADPIHKVSIVARSRSLGLTFTLPEDRFNHSRSQLRDTMAMCLGGRTAEEIVFSEPTTGAENDIEKVTRIARAMVTEYGMSEALGPQQLGQRDGEVFLGRELGHQPNYSEEVAAVIDREIRALIDQAHERAAAVLTAHRRTLDRMARELVDRETLDALDLEEILGPLPVWTSGETPPAPSRPRPPSRLVPAVRLGDQDRRAAAEPVRPGRGSGSPVLTPARARSTVTSVAATNREKTPTAVRGVARRATGVQPGDERDAPIRAKTAAGSSATGAVGAKGRSRSTAPAQPSAAPKKAPRSSGTDRNPRPPAGGAQTAATKGQTTGTRVRSAAGRPRTGGDGGGRRSRVVEEPPRPGRVRRRPEAPLP